MRARRMSEVVSGVSRGMRVETYGGADWEGWMVRASRATIEQGSAGRLCLRGMKRFVSIGRYCQWWVRPQFGSSEADYAKLVHDPSFYLLWDRGDGDHVLVLPLVDKGVRTVVTSGAKGGLTLRFEGGDPRGACPENAAVLFVCRGRDPYALGRAAAAVVAGELRTFRPRWEKAVPAYIDLLGWCTWDAFHYEVTEKKVLAGLETFRQGGVIPPFLLLDAGWQDIRDEMMCSFETHPDRFPNGLAPLIAKAKQEYGIALFGLWHAFQGFWRGVHPEGSLAERYRLVVTSEQGRRDPWGRVEGDGVRGLVHPEDVYRFYQDWHGLLRQWGVDMVKVDGQASQEEFGRGEVGAVGSMTAYQRAMQSTAQLYFRGNLLHCMSNTSDVAYAMEASLGWRNYEDHNPGWDAGHQYHIANQALNNLWSSMFAIPDWDMFQSHLPSGAFHAASRAISGGPIYVSDVPGKQDFDVLRKLCTSDGRALRCEEPAMPSPDCLYRDYCKEPSLTKVANRNGEIGVLGLFHCWWEGPREAKAEDQRAIEGVFGPADVPYLDGKRFAVWLHEARVLETCGRRGRLRIRLGWREHEVVTLAPVRNGVACLGLLDKYNGSRAIDWMEWIGAEELRVRLRDGGEIGFYCRSRPSAVRVDGRVVRFAYDERSGLLRLRYGIGRPLDVRLRVCAVL